MGKEEELVAVDDNDLQSYPSSHEFSQFQMKSDHEIPLCLVPMLEGVSYDALHDTPLIKPKWYDHEKFLRGQSFANEYYAIVNYAEMISLNLLFSFSSNLGPLIYTQRSDTPFKAGKRYLSTALRILSWYEEDVFDKNTEAYKNIRIVQNYHKNTARKMCTHSKDELKAKMLLRNCVESSEIKSSCLSTFKEDFPSGCPAWLGEFTEGRVIINQGEMSLTLFGFMGLIVLYPDKLGVKGATKEDYEGFVHLWRVIGYLMGVEDGYNFCEGSLEEVKRRCEAFVHSAFLPNLSNLNEQWEHMTRCMVEGISMTMPGPLFETTTLFLFKMTGANTTKFEERLKWKHKLKYYVDRFLFNLIMAFPSVRNKFNGWLKSRMRNKAITLFGITVLSKDHNENVALQHHS